MTRSQDASGWSTAGARSMVPALLTRMSIGRPPASRSASAATAARSAKSIRWPSNVPAETLDLRLHLAAG